MYGSVVMSHACGKTFEQYCQDDLLRLAVERALGVIGEAFSKLRAEDPSVFESITEAKKIVGLRNRLIHGYDSVDDEIVWDVVSVDLPPFISKIQTLLSP